MCEPAFYQPPGMNLRVRRTGIFLNTKTMKISLEQVKELLAVQELSFFKSTQSKRLVAYNRPNADVTFVVMTPADGKFDKKKEVYATILTPSAEHPWISDYDFAIQVSNKAGAEPVMTL